MNPLETVLHYHETSKHHLHRYARSLGYLDWASQPDPFRRFRDAPLISLPLIEAAVEPAYDDLFEPGAIESRPVGLDSLAEFLRYSLALSAWKEFQGTRWALRINPSSGNLHPTEGYLVLAPVEGLTEVAGVFHYAPKAHALERRCEITSQVWDDLMTGFPGGTFLAGLTSIHWREAWKYGERAYRYCQHDIGHALAALCLSASLQGWQVWPLNGLGDEGISMLLGLDREADFAEAEDEHPDLLIAVWPAVDSLAGSAPDGLPGDALEAIQQGNWTGQANRLSEQHVEWDVIDSVAEACIKPSPPEPLGAVTAIGLAKPLVADRPPVSARQIIEQRRSAVAMDGQTGLTAGQFFLMLDRVLPRFDRSPWWALGPPAHVHLGLFVHRVKGLTPGLYVLVRMPEQLERLRASMQPDFQWEQPAGCPPSLPLYHLTPGDARSVAKQVSCGQDIAAQGAFSLGMIADFEGPLQTIGPWTYRRLFWETGTIGQVLYLEAEAAGVRSTGIGCFFDDSVHDLFGLSGRSYQSLYHFTVGGPIEDTRLTTLPPYPPRD